MADPQSGRGGQSDLPAVVTDEELRASHADRDQAAERLRAAAGDGRLSPEELDDRLERALTARTYAELAPRRPQRMFWQWLRRAARPPAIAA